MIKATERHNPFRGPDASQEVKTLPNAKKPDFAWMAVLLICIIVAAYFIAVIASWMLAGHGNSPIRIAGKPGSTLGVLLTPLMLICAASSSYTAYSVYRRRFAASVISSLVCASAFTGFFLILS